MQPELPFWEPRPVSKVRPRQTHRPGLELPRRSIRARGRTCSETRVKKLQETLQEKCRQFSGEQPGDLFSTRRPFTQNRLPCWFCSLAVYSRPVMYPLLRKQVIMGTVLFVQNPLPCTHLRSRRDISIDHKLISSPQSLFCVVRGSDFSPGRFSEAPKCLRVWKHFLWKAFRTLFSSVFLTVSIYFGRWLCALCG